MVEAAAQTPRVITDIASTEKYLTDHGITFHTVRHEPAFTVAEGLEKVKFEGEYAGTVFAKNLFLHNQKKKENLYLVVAAHDTPVDMKGLTKHLKAASGTIRAGDMAVMESILGVGKGSVNLFAILNDTGKKIHLIIDQKLWEDAKHVGFHPM